MNIIFVVLTALAAFVSGIVIGILIDRCNDEWRGDD